MEWFFQVYLGWDIYKTTAFCAGILFLAWLPVIAIGKITGWSKGMWFDSSNESYKDKDYNSLTYEQRVALAKENDAYIKGGLLKPMLVVIVIAFIIALFKM